MISYGNFRSVRHLSLQRSEANSKRKRGKAKWEAWLWRALFFVGVLFLLSRWIQPEKPFALPGLSPPVSRMEYLKMTDLDIAAVLRKRLPESFQGFALDLARHILTLCQIHAMDPALVLAMIDEESDFNPQAISHRGAHGLMQLMPKTANWLSKGRVETPAQLLNPFENISLGIEYLAHLKALVQEMMELPEVNSRALNQWVLAAYNLGPNRLKELRTIDKAYRPSLALQRYIDGIQKNVNNFRSRRSSRNVHPSGHVKVTRAL